MNERLCPSCGHQNSDTVVYCAQCGVLLRNAPVSPLGQSLPTSVAIAARRVEKVRSSDSGGPSLGSKIFSFLVYCVSVVLGVAAVLALMNPKTGQNPVMPEGRRVQNPGAAIEQQIQSSRFTSASLSQQLVNDLLKSSGSIDWKSPSFIPNSAWPRWESSQVQLGAGVVTATVEASLFGYPLSFSETFRLAGYARQWSLNPESGSIGLLPISKPFLPLLTPFISACALPVNREMKTLEAADSLQIRSGFIDFTTR